jgi:hypothetical protein
LNLKFWKKEKQIESWKTITYSFEAGHKEYTVFFPYVKHRRLELTDLRGNPISWTKYTDYELEVDTDRIKIKFEYTPQFDFKATIRNLD